VETRPALSRCIDLRDCELIDVTLDIGATRFYPLGKVEATGISHQSAPKGYAHEPAQSEPSTILAHRAADRGCAGLPIRDGRHGKTQEHHLNF